MLLAIVVSFVILAAQYEPKPWIDIKIDETNQKDVKITLNINQKTFH